MTATNTTTSSPAARDAYAALLEHVRRANLLASTAGLLGWDQEVMMPPGGIAFRAEQLTQLAELSHAMRVAPKVGEWLDACEQDDALTTDVFSDTAVNLREIRRDFDRATKLPATLVAEFAQTSSLAKAAWQQARRDDDFKAFAPWLSRIVALNRDRAACWGWASDGEPWDALAEAFEHGMTAAKVSAVFTPLRDALASLIDRVRGSSRQPASLFANRPLPRDAFEPLLREVAATLGFDFQRGRLDTSTHPFCGGTHCNDVRLTTRFRDDMPLEPLYSTMHETGHGIYNQNLPAEHTGTPLGRPAGLSIHESQSRLWENFIGRSRAFVQWLHPQFRDTFGELVADVDADAFFTEVNLVRPSLIRVESDEMTYNLHIMVRFELERAMVSDDLSVDDLPAAWNEKYRDDLGVDVPNHRLGCLQDIHWSKGAMGYFPTYTMGNLLAAQCFEAMEAALPNMQREIAVGRFDAIKRWLCEQIHRQGKRYTTEQLCERLSGKPLSHEALIRHLSSRASEVYGV